MLDLKGLNQSKQACETFYNIHIEIYASMHTLVNNQLDG